MKISIESGPILKSAELVGVFADDIITARQLALKAVGVKIEGKLRSYPSGMERLNPFSQAIYRAKNWISGKGKIQILHGSKKAFGGGYGLPFRNPVNAISYRVHPEGSVQIGFFRGDRGPRDEALSRLIAMHAEAATIGVTAAMRRFFLAIGLPLRKTTTALHRPARPWLEPVFEQNASAIPEWFAKEFFAQLKKSKGIA